MSNKFKVMLFKLFIFFCEEGQYTAKLRTLTRVRKANLSGQFRLYCRAEAVSQWRRNIIRNSDQFLSFVQYNIESLFIFLFLMNFGRNETLSLPALGSLESGRVSSFTILYTCFYRFFVSKYQATSCYTASKYVINL
jgi:hypothetical protein